MRKAAAATAGVSPLHGLPSGSIVVCAGLVAMLGGAGTSERYLWLLTGAAAPALLP
jgi:hypothetical protein